MHISLFTHSFTFQSQSQIYKKLHNNQYYLISIINQSFPQIALQKESNNQYKRKEKKIF